MVFRARHLHGASTCGAERSHNRSYSCKLSSGWFIVGLPERLESLNFCLLATIRPLLERLRLSEQLRYRNVHVTIRCEHGDIAIVPSGRMGSSLRSGLGSHVSRWKIGAKLAGLACVCQSIAIRVCDDGANLLNALENSSKTATIASLFSSQMSSHFRGDRPLFGHAGSTCRQPQQRGVI